MKRRVQNGHEKIAGLDHDEFMDRLSGEVKLASIRAAPDGVRSRRRSFMC